MLTNEMSFFSSYFFFQWRDEIWQKVLMIGWRWEASYRQNHCGADRKDIILRVLRNSQKLTAASHIPGKCTFPGFNTSAHSRNSVNLPLSLGKPKIMN